MLNIPLISLDGKAGAEALDGTVRYGSGGQQGASTASGAILPVTQPAAPHQGGGWSRRPYLTPAR